MDKKIQNPKSKIQNPKVSPARQAAFDILQRIETEKAFSSVLLPLYEEKLSEKDRGLCHELTLGVLRSRIYLDKIIEKFTGKKTEKLDLAVLLALRIGLYQLLILDKIPAHAAINESVNLVKKAKKSSASGLVNAVLRRAGREKKFNLEFSDEIERVSVENSYPRWLIEKWISDFGFEETENLARANNEMPEVAFRSTAKTSGETKEFLNRGDTETQRIVEKSKFVENCFLISRMDMTLRDLAEKGEIYFQDEASQMVAQAIELKENESFLDVCAAPGSKTTLVARQGIQNGNLIIAGDLYLHRIETLKNNCFKQGVENVCILQYDAERSLPFADESFDIVLLDAPCSGTGTIRHNPEIRYFLQKEDFIELSGKQLRILQNASNLVKSGGRLVYSTCSLEKEENEAVIGRFLVENEKFRKVEPNVPQKFLTSENFARTFPQKDKMDGFFIAMLERI